MKQKLATSIVAVTLLLAGPFCGVAQATTPGPSLAPTNPTGWKCVLMPWTCK